jgi:hypothetical protein
MSYLHYLCMFTYSAVQSNTYCVLLLFCLSLSCVSYVAIYLFDIFRDGITVLCILCCHLFILYFQGWYN